MRKPRQAPAYMCRYGSHRCRRLATHLPPPVGHSTVSRSMTFPDAFELSLWRPTGILVGQVRTVWFPIDSARPEAWTAFISIRRASRPARSIALRPERSREIAASLTNIDSTPHRPPHVSRRSSPRIRATHPSGPSSSTISRSGVARSISYGAHFPGSHILTE
jgi:hypothetical protein